MRRTTIATMLLALALVVSACSPRSAAKDAPFDAPFQPTVMDLSAEQHEAVGDGFLSRGNPEMAFVHYNRALVKSPDNPDILAKKGRLLMDQGLHDQALEELKGALKLAPVNSLANMLAGIIYFRAGLEEDAVAHLQTALRSDNTLWRAHNAMGLILDKNGRLEEAAEHYRKALGTAVGTHAANVHNNLGMVAMARRDYPQAVSEFHEALRLGADEKRVYNNLGVALTRMNKPEQAYEAFLAAGNEASARNNLGFVLMGMNRPADAAEQFRKALDASPRYYQLAADNLRRAETAMHAPAPMANNINGSSPNHRSLATFPAGEHRPASVPAAPAVGDGATRVSLEQPLPADDIPAPAAQIEAPIEAPKAADDARGNEIQPQHSGWGIHVSSWKLAEQAGDHADRLREMGYEASIVTVDLGAIGVWHRVFAGPYSSSALAKANRGELMQKLALDRAPIMQITGGSN